MADCAIEAAALGKHYVIGHRQAERYVTLRDVLARGASTVLRRMADVARGSPIIAGDGREDVWALRDVSFDIRRGEAVGVIGANGAGKSTLLKILARVTRPSQGRARLRGRVASLLEVGTGFHPELTGRENVFLNGAILGMRRAETRARFDEIVAFAEVERYLDTPVKRYSSGMYMRLAFAVAAHLDADILLVDEVLAVGDVAFQKKCAGRMRDASRSGRTVLFVSHNLGAVQQVCARTLVLAGGVVRFDGPTREAIDVYAPLAATPTIATVQGGGVCARIDRVTVEGPVADGPPRLPLGRPWSIRLDYTVERQLDDFVAAIGIVNEAGMPVQTVWSTPAVAEPGRYEALFTQDRVILAPGRYAVFAGLTAADRAVHQVEAGGFDITVEDSHGYFQLPYGAGAVLNSMQVRTRPL